MLIVEAAASSRLDLLKALRDLVASQQDEGVPARELTALSRLLCDIGSEIEGIAAASGDGVGVAAVTPDEWWAVALGVVAAGDAFALGRGHLG